MALLAARRKGKDPEGRMPLREHLTEFRSRLIRAGLAILAGAVVGWFISKPLIEALLRPLIEAAEEQGKQIQANFGSLSGAFSQKVRISLYTGVVLAAPVWLYQLWAFIVPGLTKKEKRYSLAFVGAAVPLFAAGIYVAWNVVPGAVLFFTDFIPTSASNLVDAEGYLTFVTRLMLTFGLAFIAPLLLVALNIAGLLSAATLIKGWRLAVFVSFLFAALASPTGDAATMLALAGPLCALYALATGIAWVVDRRRAKRDQYAGLGDEEASSIDDATPLEDADPVDPARE